MCLKLMVSGWLYDVLHSYIPAFYVAGSTISLSGLILFFIPMIERRNARQQWMQDTPLEQIQQDACRGPHRDYPVIVLNSPSTPSSTGSTEDTYSNRVYTTAMSEYNYNLCLEDDNCEYMERMMDECDVHLYETYQAHSRKSVNIPTSL